MLDTLTTTDLMTLFEIKDRSTIIRRAEREGWKFKPRAGQGGGKDWIIASMPKGTREAIATAMLAQGLSADLEASAQVPQESSLADLTEHQRRTALARLVIVKEIERTAALIGKKDKAVLLFLAAVKAGTLASHVAELVPVANDKYGDGKKQSISRETLYRWKKQYAEEGVLALAPLHCTKQMGVPAWAKAFLAEYQQPQKPSARDAYKRFAETYPSPPSLDQVYYWLKKVGIPAREAGRVTGNALRKLRKHKRRLTDEFWPGDIYTADGTTFDAEVQHPIHGQPWKPEVTFMVDVATRRCVGISLGDAESGLVVLDALRMACLFGGIPCYLYVDNGSGYKNKMMTGEGLGMMARLDIEMRHSIPKSPQGKGLMERAVQTICEPLSKLLPSCTHKDMDRDAAKKVFHIGRAELRAHGKSGLLPTFDIFRDMILKRVVEYNASPHRALPRVVDMATGKRRNMTPDEYWNSFMERGFAPLLVPEAIRDELFMPSYSRKVSNCEIHFKNAIYFAGELEEFHGKRVDVRYDIWDASKVYCWTTDGRKICTALLNGNAIHYFPLPEVEARRERRANGRVARLFKEIKQIAPGATMQLPEAPATYTMIADSFTPRQPLASAQPESAAPNIPVCQDQEAVPSARPKLFGSHQKRYTWLMYNRDHWTDADYAWMTEYVQSAHYAGLHEYYLHRNLAWTGETDSSARTESAPQSKSEAQPVTAITPLKRPIFTTEQERYVWLMENQERWSEKDSAWIAVYVKSTWYAKMHEDYVSRGIAWPEMAAQCGEG